MSYKTKTAIILVFVILTGYYSQYIYRTLPSQMGFSIKWDTADNQLLIASVHPDLQDSLQVGDVIAAINDVEVTRRSVLPTPRPEQYRLHLIRADRPITTIITPLDNHSRVFTDLYASFTMLVIGAAILLIGNKKSDIVPAFVFMLTAVGWLTIPSFQYGESTAWIIGYMTVPIMGPLYTQLAYSVKSDQNAQAMPNWLKGWLSLSIVWGVIGGFEYLYLFPQRVSIHSLFHVEWLAISYLSVGIGLLLSVIIILFRAVKLPPSYTKRQLVILVLFVTVGTLPFVFLTVIPRVFTGAAKLPGPISFALLLLLPLGFLFIVLRRQHLYIEMATSRILVSLLLTVTFIIVFSVVRLNLIHRGFDIPQETSLIVIGVGLLSVYPNSTLLNGMRVILYGKNQLTQRDMQAIARQVTQRPNWKTVEQTLQKVAQALELENIVLYEWKEIAYQRIVCGYPIEQGDAYFPYEINPISILPTEITHISHIDELNNLFLDKSIYMPIMTADFLTGFIVASAGSTLEQLNERDLFQLRQLSDTLPQINMSKRSLLAMTASPSVGRRLVTFGMQPHMGAGRSNQDRSLRVSKSRLHTVG